jgi:hypothetical protein
MVGLGKSNATSGVSDGNRDSSQVTCWDVLADGQVDKFSRGRSPARRVTAQELRANRFSHSFAVELLWDIRLTQWISAISLDPSTLGAIA